jgi:hypothetical protein
MNAPLHYPQDGAPYGTPDLYREQIGEAAWSIGLYAEQIQRYCTLGDDAGLEYSTRCLIAHARFAAGILADLKSMKAEQAARQQSLTQPAAAKESAHAV